MYLEEVLDFVKTMLVCFFVLILFCMLLLLCTIPLLNKQCDKFNKLYKTEYTHSEWWWNSEAIKLSFAGTKNDK